MAMLKFALVALLAVAAVASAQTERRLIETKPNVRAWMTEEEVLNLIVNNVGFMDVTDTPNLARGRAPAAMALPSGLRYQSTVKSLIPSLDADNIEANLRVFTSFNNRYYRSESGKESAAWLFELVKDIASNNSAITVSTFAHSWGQNSVIARIPGSSSSSEILVIGAHQDSINQLYPTNGRAPGADDDGTGSMTLVELLRVLVATNFRPQLTIEFHWYSAEEAGLLGSQAVANDYKSKGIAVRSMLQLDMTGYTGIESVVGLITDFTDSELNAFVRLLVDEYLNIPYVNSRCNYGCSDHASWNRAGYKSAFPFESQFGNNSPVIHTPNDTIDTVNFKHVLEFAKLGLSFLIELSFL